MHAVTTAVAPTSPEGRSATSALAMVTKTSFLSASTKQEQQRQCSPPGLLAWTKELMDSESESDSEDDASSFNDEDDYSVDESVDAQETVVVKALVKAAFDGSLAKPVFDRLLAGKATAQKRARQENLKVQETIEDGISVSPKKKKARLSPSAPGGQQANRRNSLRLSQSEPTSLFRLARGTNNDEKQQAPSCTLKPDDFLKSRLESAGYTYKTHKTLELKGFFLNVTTESVEAYDMPVLQALREQDIDALQQMQAAGRTLQCSNRFGESIVHTCARRGYDSVLRFLLDQAGVSLRVRCDYGRTVLHDACWTAQPNFSVIDMILDHCPDLFYMTDRRGFTPLQYIQPDQSNQWVDYLASKSIEQLAPKEL